MSQSKSKEGKLIALDTLEEASACLRTIAHPLRLRMIQMMLEDEFTVGELAEACDIPSHMASEHLGKMKDRGLLSCERQGRCMYYRIEADGLSGIIDCIRTHFE